MPRSIIIKNYHNKNGTALVLILIIIAVVAILAGTITKMATTHMQEMRILELKSQQRYLLDYYKKFIKSSAAWNNTRNATPAILLHEDKANRLLSDTTTSSSGGPVPLLVKSGDNSEAIPLNGRRLNGKLEVDSSAPLPPSTPITYHPTARWEIKAEWEGLRNHIIVVKLSIAYLKRNEDDLSVPTMTFAQPSKQCFLTSKQMTTAEYDAAYPAFAGNGTKMAMLDCRDPARSAKYPALDYIIMDIRDNPHPSSSHLTRGWQWGDYQGECKTKDITTGGLMGLGAKLPFVQQPQRDLNSGIVDYDICYALCCSKT